ncbi:mucin-2-like [Musca vetustissima]|uniref:mucin-2-like n=1 Tax=Musca vetustissima TaxID=27455 RepID=UPI002AB703D7|nr:mucin-2-like [Musca vetustissima]
MIPINKKHTKPPSPNPGKDEPSTSKSQNSPSTSNGPRQLIDPDNYTEMWKNVKPLTAEEVLAKLNEFGSSSVLINQSGDSMIPINKKHTKPPSPNPGKDEPSTSKSQNSPSTSNGPRQLIDPDNYTEMWKNVKPLTAEEVLAKLNEFGSSSVLINQSGDSMIPINKKHTKPPSPNPGKDEPSTSKSQNSPSTSNGPRQLIDPDNYTEMWKNVKPLTAEEVLAKLNEFGSSSVLINQSGDSMIPINKKHTKPPSPNPGKDEPSTSKSQNSPSTSNGPRQLIDPDNYTEMWKNVKPLTAEEVLAKLNEFGSSSVLINQSGDSMIPINKKHTKPPSPNPGKDEPSTSKSQNSPSTSNGPRQLIDPDNYTEMWKNVKPLTAEEVLAKLNEFGSSSVLINQSGDSMIPINKKHTKPPSPNPGKDEPSTSKSQNSPSTSNGPRQLIDPDNYTEMWKNVKPLTAEEVLAKLNEFGSSSVLINQSGDSMIPINKKHTKPPSPNPGKDEPSTSKSQNSPSTSNGPRQLIDPDNYTEMWKNVKPLTAEEVLAKLNEFGSSSVLINQSGDSMIPINKKDTKPPSPNPGKDEPSTSKSQNSPSTSNGPRQLIDPDNYTEMWKNVKPLTAEEVLAKLNEFRSSSVLINQSADSMIPINKKHTKPPSPNPGKDEPSTSKSQNSPSTSNGPRQLIDPDNYTEMWKNVKPLTAEEVLAKLNEFKSSP